MRYTDDFVLMSKKLPMETQVLQTKAFKVLVNRFGLIKPAKICIFVSSLVNADDKVDRKPYAGKPHAAFDEAVAGNMDGF